MFDVLVVGAGISGLSAARLLTAAGLDVRVLEARDRVGGRTCTLKDPASFDYTDVGGAYVGPTQRRVARLAAQLGLELYRVQAGEEKLRATVQGRNGGVMTHVGVWPFLFNVFHVLDRNAMFRTIRQLSKQVSASEPWNAEKAKEWDSTTVKEFLDAICWTQYAKDLMTLECHALLCAETHQISLLSFLWYVSCGQGLDRVLVDAQERKFIGGSMQLSERMAEQLNDKVKLSSPVVRVEQCSSSEVKVHTLSGEIFFARHVISALPYPLLNRIAFAPPLPAAKSQLIQRMPMGSVIKSVMFYERAFWREKGLSGEFASLRGPASHGTDDSKPDGSCPAIISYIWADAAVKVLSLTKEERRELLAKQHANMFRCPQLLAPINYVEQNWMAEEYSGGCYGSTYAPGTLTLFGEEMRKPFQNVYFAGTETANYWSGYMEGAVQAGERAAREVLHARGKIAAEEIWVDEAPSPDFIECALEESLLERILPSVPVFLTMLALPVAAGFGLLLYRHGLLGF